MSDSVKKYEEAAIKELNHYQEKFAGQPRVLCATSLGDDIFDFTNVKQDDIVFGIHGDNYIVAKAKNIKSEQIEKCYLKYVTKTAKILRLKDESVEEFWKHKTVHKGKELVEIINPDFIKAYDVAKKNPHPFTVEVPIGTSFIDKAFKEKEFNEPSMYPHGKPEKTVIIGDPKIGKQAAITMEEIENQGKRYNTGKLRWSLVSWKALEPMVKVLMFGANKYEDHNWKKGLKYTEVVESLQRHITSFVEGEDNDRESKLSHVGHILCNAMFLSYMYLFRKDMDDRYEDHNLKCCGEWDEKGNCSCTKQLK